MTTSTSTITATFVGGPTVRLGYAGRAILTDPTFDQPGSYEAGGVVLTKLAGPGLTPEQLGAVDVVLLSHDQHADNLDHAGRDYLARVPVTLSTAAAADRLPDVIPLLPWQTHRLENPAGPTVEVTAVPAQHGPVGCEPVSGPVIGFVLQAAGWPTVYVSGDNASVDVLAEIVARFPGIEVAVLFVGAANVGRFGHHNVTLGSDEAPAVAALLAAAVVLPVHAQDWAHFTEPLSAFVHAYTAASPSARLVALPRGETVEVA
jgi:L-ascorbate metabolism protein UlaG (beta-lactamase superfamily)